MSYSFLRRHSTCCIPDCDFSAHTNHILTLPRFRIHLPIPNFIPTAIYLCNLTAHMELLLIQMGFKWLHLPA